MKTRKYLQYILVLIMYLIPLHLISQDFYTEYEYNWNYPEEEIEKFGNDESNLDYSGYLQTGGSTFKGCYNTQNNKIYLIQTRSYNNKSFICIYNGESNELINTISLNYKSQLKSCTYNSLFNKIYITSYGNNQVIVLDGNNDYEVLTAFCPGNQPDEIYSLKESNLVVCGCNNKIAVIDAENDVVIASITNPYAEVISNFVESELINNKIYASCYEDNGKILSVDLSNYQIDDYVITNNTPVKLAYNSLTNYIYAYGNILYNPSTVCIIQESPFELINSIDINPKASSIKYNYLENKLYLLSSGYAGGITVINGENNEIIKEIDIVGHHEGLTYNPINNKVYFHTIINNTTPEKEMIVYAIDCDNDEISSIISLEQYQNFGEGAGWITGKEDIIFNPVNNQIYLGNRGFSNISIIQCSTQKLSWPNSGWKWLSFPRLERYGNEFSLSIPLLERLNCFPCPVYMFYEFDVEETRIEYDIEYLTWTGGLQAIQSTKGYKLNLESSIETVELDLHGAKLDHETEMTIYPGQENWLGYFLDYPQKIKNCIPQDVWNDLSMIITQYWSMKRISSGIDEWFIKGKVTPVNYGDLVILKTNAQNTFAWLDSGEEEQEEEIPKTQYYEYEEQAVYLPIFVEFDESSDAQEVAVIADGEVKGAAVRFPGDTIVHICSYLEGVPSDTQLEFETYNGYKSAPVDEKDYIVYNRFSKKKEKRKIYAGESTDFQWVSLKQGEVYEIPNVLSDVSCRPNPFTNKTLITYRINETTDVQIEVYDINGKIIKTLVNGELTGGYYKTVWTGNNENGSKVNGGIYFYKILTGNGFEFIDKIVIL